MSTSYPYLTLARRFGVDYGDVLAYADWLKSAKEAACDPQGVPCTDPWMLKALRNLNDDAKKAIMAEAGITYPLRRPDCW